MKKLALIGTKEFSQQIIDIIKFTNEFIIAGYFDDQLPSGTIVEGFPVFGNVSDAESIYKQGVFDCIFIAIGYTHFELRELYYNQLKGKIPFANIVINSSKVENNAIIGEGVFIGGRSYIGRDTIIEDNVFIHGDSSIAHNCIIKKHSYLAGRNYLAGFSSIGSRCFIGLNTCIADHISICDDVWVGIACTIGKDIKQSGKYMSPSAKLYKIE